MAIRLEVLRALTRSQPGLLDGGPHALTVDRQLRKTPVSMGFLQAEVVEHRRYDVGDVLKVFHATPSQTRRAPGILSPFVCYIDRQVHIGSVNFSAVNTPRRLSSRPVSEILHAIMPRAMSPRSAHVA